MGNYFDNQFIIYRLCHLSASWFWGFAAFVSLMWLEIEYILGFGPLFGHNITWSFRKLWGTFFSTFWHFVDRTMNGLIVKIICRLIINRLVSALRYSLIGFADVESCYNAKYSQFISSANLQSVAHLWHRMARGLHMLVVGLHLHRICVFFLLWTEINHERYTCADAGQSTVKTEI